MSTTVQLPDIYTEAQVRAFALGLVAQTASAMAVGITVTETINQADQLATYILKGKTDHG